MFNKLRTTLLSMTACVLTLVAMSGAGTNSLWLIHEPDIPESIKKDL